MDIISLDCNECGAPIDVPRSTNYLTCKHCGARLTVRQTDSAMYTETIQEIAQRTTRIEEQVSQLRRSDLVERIDREWELEREKYMVTSKQGGKSVPSTGASLVGGIIATLFGTMWMIFTAAFAGPFALFGLLFIGMGVFGAISSHNKARAYRVADSRYQSRRREATTM